MAEIVLTKAYIEIGGNNLSDHFSSVTIETTADVQEATAFGDAWRTRLGGLKDFSISADFMQDFDAGQLDAVLFPLLGTNVAIEIRPDNASVGANNPKFTGNAILSSYPPLGNSTGETATGSISLMGNGELTRAVT